jgi:hypothetical protein
MKLWMSAEVDARIADELRPIRNAIEKHINKYLEETGYENEKLKDWDIIITLRNDDVFDEIINYRPKKKDTEFHLKIDYSTFKNATQEERANLILNVLIRSLNILEEKGVENLGVIKEYIESCKYPI